MNINILVASVLSFGLLAPVAYAGEGNNFNCSEEQQNRHEFIDCKPDAAMSVTKAFAAVKVANPKSNTSIGDFIDETRDESNLRSSRN